MSNTEKNFLSNFEDFLVEIEKRASDLRTQLHLKVGELVGPDGADHVTVDAVGTPVAPDDALTRINTVACSIDELLEKALLDSNRL